MKKYRLLIVSLIILFSGIIQASEKNILLRIDRLERMMQNNSQSKVLIKLKQLQQENQELRSQIEEVSYLNDKLTNRLHALNKDMDRRVLSLESVVAENDQVILLAGATTKQAVDNVNSISLDNSGKKIHSSRDNFIQNTQDSSLQSTTGGFLQNSTDGSVQSTVEEREFMEQRSYQTAFNELKAQRYGKAGESFILFIQQYPDSSYAHLAQYWLAESSYAQRNFKQSIKNYTDLLNNYPRSTKRSEASLKIAFCHYELGKNKSAKSKLLELIKEHPNSTESGQAKRLLKKLK